MKFSTLSWFAISALFSTSYSEKCDKENGFCEINDEVAPKGSNEKGEPRKVDMKECIDRHPTKCPDYHANGECERNPGWMIINCPVTCNVCHLLDPKVRCQRQNLNISDTPVFVPGDMNKMFESISDRFQGTYDITVHSTSPWVVTFDNFLSDEEVDALISTNENSWERSTDTGSVNEYGETGRILSKKRTSSNSWCRANCLEHTGVQSAMAKIRDVTGIPQGNSESFQILKYDIGQAYAPHHDFGGGRQAQLACGPRILTFFLYLSDVEEGGETHFPLLGISVKPKKGKALLWPSVVDDDLLQFERRTLHEAKPVISGKKYAANSWIHLYDYETPNLWGCTGTFDVI